MAALLDTDDAYTGDEPDAMPCWGYADVAVSVSYKEEAGRVSTGDYGIDKCFFQYYTEKSLNASDKIIASAKPRWQPRICSRARMGYSIIVLSGRHPATFHLC